MSVEDLICTTCTKSAKGGIGCWFKRSKVCSECFIQKTITEFGNMGNNTHCYACDFWRGEKYETNIMSNIIKIFDEFKSKYPKYKNAVIPNDDEFKAILKTLGENLDSGFWYRYIHGLKNDFKDSPLFFTDEHAKRLRQLVIDNKKYGESYEFAQVMSSSLLLIYLMSPLNGPWNWATKIKTPDKMMIMWNDKFSCLRQIKSFKLIECTICLEDVNSSDAFIVCGTCKNIAHYKCKMKYLEEKSPDSMCCEFCRSKYIDDKDVEIYNYTIIKSMGGEWTWKDHLKDWIMQ